MTEKSRTEGSSRVPKPIFRARIARALRLFATLRGWQTVVNKLVPSHRGHFTVRNGNSIFEGDIGSYIDRQVYLFGGYEAALIRCFLSNVPPKRRCTVLDIGANVGTHSLAFARVFESVIAFEPNPSLWPQFEKNMALNGLTNVHLHKIGLADRDADLPLYLIDKSNFGLGTFSTEEQYDLPLHPSAVCAVRHAGNYLDSIGVGRVDAIKIDVQGFEPEVLLGLSTMMKRDRPVLWFEVGTGTLAKIKTVADLHPLVPFSFRCYAFKRPYWRRNVAVLRETQGGLPNGDYLIMPE